MKHPFTIIRGGQAEAEKKPVKSKASSPQFEQFDRSRKIIEQIKKEFIASRNAIILKQRAKL